MNRRARREQRSYLIDELIRQANGLRDDIRRLCFARLVKSKKIPT
jgi:hypothetical protein